MSKPVSGKTTVVVHPLVLLSVVDHYNRACKGTKNRAVGCLLGSWQKGGILDIATSFAVPFEEDSKNPDVWFLDHDYLEAMFAMFRKVNAKERVVGWYHTGPKLRPSDIRINDLMTRFVHDPVLVIVDVQPSDVGLPTRAYFAVEDVHDDGTPTSKTFEHLTSEIGAEEAEEVGVEHLLRDVTNIGAYGSLSERIKHQLGSLKGLFGHLSEIRDYLELVVQGKLPINHPIVYQLQDVFNLLPNIQLEEFVKSVTMTTSDQMLVLYLASIVRSTLALHNLINNKVMNLEDEAAADGAKTKAVAAAADADKAASEGDDTAAAAADEKKPDSEAGDEKK